MRDAFAHCHPALNVLFYFMVMGVTVFYLHPILLALSGLGVGGYLLYMRGVRGGLRTLGLALPVVVLSAVVNPLFSHQGLTVLGHLPTGNPVTLESVVYGLCVGGMMGVMFLWCATWNQVMTSDKLSYVLGKAFPALSLLFSMILGFLPRFLAQGERVVVAQRCVGRDVRMGNIWQRLTKGTRVFSILVTWALEGSVDMADAMRARGYGLRGRTQYHLYLWDRRTLGLLVSMLVCFGGVLGGATIGELELQFFPIWRMNPPTPFAWVCYGLYGLLCGLPLILNVVEDLKWRYWMCKI